MADNFITFSEILPNLKQEEEAWLKDFLARPEESEFESWTDEQREAWLKEHDVDDLYDWPGFEYRFNETEDWGRYLWIYAEELGSTRLVGMAVQAFLKTFRPKDCFTLSYAATCSKLRAGEFGGGAIFVTADSIDEMDSADWACEKMKIRKSRAKRIKPARSKSKTKTK